jgi:hypothetical protein
METVYPENGKYYITGGKEINFHVENESSLLSRKADTHLPD